MTVARPNPLSQLPLRVGQLLAAPGAGMARIDVQGGGLNDAIALVVIGALAFRVPELVQGVLALFGPTSGSFVRLLGVFASEVREAAWIVMPAAVVVTASAGARRDSGRDLDLGAACYAAAFVVRAIARTADAIAGAHVWPPRVTLVASAVAAGLLAIRAIGVARARPAVEAGAKAKTMTDADGAAKDGVAGTTAGAPVPAPPPAGARLIATAITAIVLVGTAGNVVWAARHVDTLRPMRQGQQAPSFALPRIDGNGGTFGSRDLEGQVALLDFWATWCGPCVAMLPVLENVHRTFASQGVSFLGVNSDGGGATLDEIKAFIGAHPIPYPTVIDNGRVGGLYRVEALPTFVVVGRDGRIRASFLGYTSQSTLEKALREALK